MICSCQNMTLSTMIVLKPHKVSLYIFISGVIFYYYSTCSLFLAILPLIIFQSFFSFTLLYTPISALLFYLYFFGHCCYNLFSGTFFLISHTVVAISCYHISFLSSTVYLSLLRLPYSLMIPKLYSYTWVLHMTPCSFCILLPSILK